MADKTLQTQNDADVPGLDWHWHLAASAVEVDTTELEFALMRTFEGFGRWQSECLASVCELAATGPENALLHIIRMNERPKTIKDLARLTNRDDVPNIQYSLRKLIGAEPAVDIVEKDNAYEITAELPGIDQKDIDVDLTDGVQPEEASAAGVALAALTGAWLTRQP